MALDTFTNLRTTILDWIDRAGDPRLTDAVVQDFIILAEDDFLNKAKFREIERSLSETIASGVIAVPTDYSDAGFKFVFVDRAPVQILERVDMNELLRRDRNRVATGIPCRIARNTTNFEFGPFPDSDYDIKGTYYKKVTRLSSGNASNEILVRAPSLYLFGALAQTEQFLKNDPRVQLWKSQYNQKLAELNQESKEEEQTGSPFSAEILR